MLPTCSRSRWATPATSPRTGAASARRFATDAPTRLPRMVGGQASGAAPLVLGQPVDDPQTVATAIRIGNPASWSTAIEARDQSEGLIAAVDDEAILDAQRRLARIEGDLLRARIGCIACGARGRCARRNRRTGVAGRVRPHRQRSQGSGRRRGRARADSRDRGRCARAGARHRGLSSGASPDRRPSKRRQPRARFRHPRARAAVAERHPS